MSGAPEVATSVPTGNTFDKYGSTNPVVRRLMAGFEGTLEQLFGRAAPDSVLDVGCGEGVLTYRWAQQLGDRPVLGVDLADPKLEAEWSTRRRPNLEFRATAATELPFADRSYDLAAAIEVLEHVPEPERTLAEMARVAARYVRELGNTPGHVNHWSKQSFVAMASRHGEVIEARSPFPWTMLLVRVG
jgi:SAM-dependent methyltransferase